MRKDKTTLEILKFIYISQNPSKKLLRSMKGSYDFMGRKIKKLIDEKYILETKIKDINSVVLTKKGLEYLKSHIYINENFDKLIRIRIKGDKNKIRQSKFAMMLQMLIPFIPDLPDDYIDFYNSLLSDNFYVNNNLRKNKIENIRNELYKRERESEAKNNLWFFSLKEMRDIDTAKLKNIPSTRTGGILHTPTGEYVLYNHYKKRMRCYGNFESVFKQFAEEICDKPLDGAIHFGASFQVLLNTLTKTIDSQRNSYILSSLIYPKQYYVPLTSEGIKQLKIYTFKNFKDRIRNALLDKNDIRNAKDFVLDGMNEKQCFYLGFECDYNELDILYKNISSMYMGKELVIYCFPHQSYFYEQLFKNTELEIRILPFEAVYGFLEKKGE